MEEFDEANVLLLCKKQDRIGQEMLFKKHSAVMLGVCVRYLKNRDVARDLLHDGFIKIFDKINTYKGNSSLATWMTRIFINLSLDYLKRTSNKVIQPDFEVIESNLSKDNSDTDITINNVSGSTMMEAVQKLPDKYRIIVNLHIVDEYTHREISKMFGIPEGTSKSYLSRGLKLIMKILTLNEVIHERA